MNGVLDDSHVDTDDSVDFKLDALKGTWCDGVLRGRGRMVCCWMIRISTQSTLMTEIVCTPRHRLREALKQRHRQRVTLQQRTSPASPPLSSASTRERSLKATRPLQQWAPAPSGLGFCASGWLTPCVGPILRSANKLVKSTMMGFGGDSDDSDDSADKRQDTIKWLNISDDDNGLFLLCLGLSES